MHAEQSGEGVLECGRRRMTRVVCESGTFAVRKRAVPRNRMREIFTSGCASSKGWRVQREPDPPRQESGTLSRGWQGGGQPHL